MEKIMFLLLFLTGVLSQSIPRKYYLIPQPLTWSQAQAYCRTKHNDLATVASNDDLVKILDVINKNQFTSNAWIGLYLDVTHWYWSYGTQWTGSYTKWASSLGEPNNAGGHEQCVALTSSGWFDLSCTDLRPFVCFDVRNTGAARYILYTNVYKTWQDAQSYCRQYHTDLASTKDDTEYYTVYGMGINPNPWLGLFRDPWKWSDNTPATWFNWYLGQPGNSAGNENCACMYANGQTDDVLCTLTKPFFCHRAITGQKRYIRVKVQSDQDVNDLAVMAAILEKIKEKLIEHGLKNNTLVKWREQPGGDVFKNITVL